MLDSIRSRYAVVAGKHIPFRRVVHKGVVFDPGSVGLSLGVSRGPTCSFWKTTSTVR